MLTQEQKHHFFHYGFLRIPGVLSQAEVAWLRDFALAKFNIPPHLRGPGDMAGYIFDIYSRYPEIRWVLLHDTINGVLRSLLGEDFAYLREVAIHKEGYGGWHRDSDSLEKAGHRFHYRDDCLLVQTALYFQDNTYMWGGGLDVIPGLHQSAEHVATGPDYHHYHAYSIPSRAGDLLLFNYRLPHRASPRRSPIVPRDHQKLAIFSACSTNTPYVQAYHDFIGQIPWYGYLKEFAYPADLIAEARAAGVSLP